MDDFFLSCSGDEGRCDRSVPRADADMAITRVQLLVGRSYDLHRDGERWLVFVGVSGEIESVRCPEHRDSIL